MQNGLNPLRTTHRSSQDSWSWLIYLGGTVHTGHWPLSDDRLGPSLYPLLSHRVSHTLGY